FVATDHVRKAGDFHGSGERRCVEVGEQGPDRAGVVNRQLSLDAAERGVAEWIERCSSQPAGGTEGLEERRRPTSQSELVAHAEAAEEWWVQQPGDLAVGGGMVEEQAGDLVLVLVGEEFVVPGGDGGGEGSVASSPLFGGPGLVHEPHEVGGQSA